MSLTNQSVPEQGADASGNNLWTSPVWSILLRILGIVAAVLLFLLATKQGTASAGGLFRTVFYSFSAVLLLLPWSRIPERLWKRLFVVFVITMGVLVFVQMYEVLSIYSQISPEPQGATDNRLFQLSTGTLTKETKPRPPIDRGVILFFALLQIPAILFRRYPDSMR